MKDVLISNDMPMTFQEFLEYKLFEAGEFSFTVYRLATLILILLIVKLLLWFIKKAMQRAWKIKKVERGTGEAIFQITKYFVWVLAIVLVLETLGVDVTILLAGSAALLVGIGLGLQQTFNDIISGIILLLEGTTRVGDILEVEGDVVKMKRIGLRASKVMNRDDIMIFIPNSLLVTNKVINWSHQLQETRFKIKVGVAYGSDVDLVLRLMEQSAREHEACSIKKPPEARFCDFGESSLNFEVLFWSKEMFRIDKVLSDIRRSIDAKFRSNDVTIPFPQRDLHIKSNQGIS